MSTLALVPQMVEAVPLVEALKELGIAMAEMRIGQLAAWYAPDLSLVVAVSGHGKAQTAVQAQYAIDRCSGVARVLCVGGAGAVSLSVARLDVVVGLETVEHDYRLGFVEGPIPRHAGDAGSIEVLRAKFAPETPEWLRFGVIASGDEDIVD